MAGELLACVTYLPQNPSEIDASKANIIATVVSTPTHPHPKQTYIGRHGWKQDTATYPKTFTNGHWLTCSMWFYFESDDMPNVDTIMAMKDNADGSYLTVEWSLSPATKQFVVMDSNDAVMATITGVTAGRWHKLEVKCKPQSGTSPVRVVLDNELVFTSASEDCDPGNATNTVYFLGGNRVNDFTKHIYFANVVLETDSEVNIDDAGNLYRERLAKSYKTDIANAVPDFGNNLDSGTWDDTMERPINDANVVQYNVQAFGPQHEGGVTCNGSGVEGPKNDSDADNKSIIGAAWGWRYKRTSGFGSSQTLVGMFGANATASTDGTSDTAQQSSTTSFKDYWEYAGHSSADAPTASEWIQIGFRPGVATDRRHMIVGEMWAIVVYEEPITIDDLQPHF